MGCIRFKLLFHNNLGYFVYTAYLVLQNHQIAIPIQKRRDVMPVSPGDTPEVQRIAASHQSGGWSFTPRAHEVLTDAGRTGVWRILLSAQRSGRPFRDHSTGFTSEALDTRKAENRDGNAQRFVIGQGRRRMARGAWGRRNGGNTHRLHLHHWHIVTIRGDCHRMRQHSELWQALQRLRGVGNSLTREGEGGHNGLNRARYLRRRSAQISPA